MTTSLEEFTRRYDTLAALDSPNAVAKFLSDRDVHGLRDAASSCPIAVYLSADDMDVIVTESVTAFYSTAKGAESDQRMLTPAMTAFIVKFDGGEYEQLEYV